MSRTRLSVKFAGLLSLVVLIPILSTLYVYQGNMDLVETGTTQKMFRERYASYDQVFDYVEVTYGRDMGVPRISRAIQQLLNHYQARLQVVRADGTVLFDSEDPMAPPAVMDLNYELKLSDPRDLFSTRNKYIRPLRQVVPGDELELNPREQVLAYAIITDDMKVLEANLYQDMQQYYLRPYYVGALAFLLLLSASLWILWREILVPIRNLRHSTRKVAAGNLDFPMDCSTDNEIGDLCEDFSQMKQRLMKSLQKRLEEKDQSRMYVKSIAEDLREPVDRLETLRESLPEDKALEVERIGRELNRTLEDLSRYTDFELSRFVLEREIISSYRFFAILKDRRVANHTERTWIEIREPRENSMLYLDIKRMIRMIDNLIMRMDDYTQGSVPLIVESASDVLEYNMLQIKMFWEDPGVLEEATLEETLEHAYRQSVPRHKQELAAALVFTREVLEDLKGDMELISGDGQVGFIIRIPRYTPDMQ